MATPVALPPLGESVTEGTVTRWLKQVGDSVAVDEPLVVVSTDKVDTEIPSPVSGTLLEIKAAEEETVEIGAVLALIGEVDAAPSAAAAAPSGPATAPSPAVAAEPAAAAEPATHPPARQPETPAQPATSAEPSGDATGDLTPMVRKLASDHGVDLSTVTGTGAGGRIRKQDVLDAAAARTATAPAAPTPPAPVTAPVTPDAPPGPPVASAAPRVPFLAEPGSLRGRTVAMSRLRKVIAARMMESLAGSAQLTQVIEVDVTLVGRLRAAAKDEFAVREGVRLSFFPFFVKAALDALKAHPKLNAAIDNELGEVTFFDHEHLAVAVDTERGLLSPVIRNAGDLNVAGLARKIADVAARTRANQVSPDELSGGTFTVTNTGSVGALFDTPIINPPQVAILGVGTVVKRPVVIDDPTLGETIAVRQMAYLSLTYDHRLVDGADAARFLQEVKTRLEAGQFEI